MAELYARLIMLGKKTIEDIPEQPDGFKELVLSILDDHGYISAD